MRMCVGCKNSKSKKELIRIVRTPDNQLEIDLTGKKSGRGAYICYNVECLEKAVKNKGLEKALNRTIDNEILMRLMKELTDNNE
ncbi:MAG TPA: YlxR family protein [Thermoanaerobacterales bacterium]|nr:YlxR family protein [Thermoanaerobacterales bacterium]